MTSENRTFDPAGLLRLLDGRYADVCAGALVEAFGIPDEGLGAPIGLSDHRPARD